MATLGNVYSRCITSLTYCPLLDNQNLEISTVSPHTQLKEEEILETCRPLFASGPTLDTTRAQKFLFVPLDGYFVVLCINLHERQMQLIKM